MLFYIVFESLKERLLGELLLHQDKVVVVCEVQTKEPPKIAEKIFVDHVVS